MESKQIFLVLQSKQSHFGAIKKWLIKSTRNEAREKDGSIKSEVVSKRRHRVFYTLISISYASIHAQTHTCPTSSSGFLKVSDNNNEKNTNEHTKNINKFIDEKSW